MSVMARVRNSRVRERNEKCLDLIGITHICIVYCLHNQLQCSFHAKSVRTLLTNKTNPEMPYSRDLKSGDPLFLTTPRNFNGHPRPTRQIDPDPKGNDLGQIYEVLHDVHTIKFRNHRFDPRNNLCQ